MKPVSPATSSRLYASPEVYDVAFGWDLTLETDFLESCWANLVEGPVRRILEPACGSGRILKALGDRGYDGLGYDRSPEMVAYASKKLAPVGGRALRGDMATFRPPGRFDAALNLVNSIGYLYEDSEVLGHLERVAGALRPGGIYVVQFNYAEEAPEAARFGPWENRSGDMTTSLTWEVLREDPLAKRSHQHCRIVARRGGEEIAIDEDHVLRLWTHEDVDRLLAESPFELLAVYRDRFEPLPLDAPRTGAEGNLYHVLRPRVSAGRGRA
jgi:SAM-dependent methyltransferase